MSGKRDIERILDGWLAEGPTEAPDRILSNLETRIEGQPQRPAWHIHIREVRMGRYARPLAAVAAAVIVVVAGILVWRSPGQAIVGATPSPASSTLSPSPVNGGGPSAEPIPSLRPVQALASVNVGVSTGSGGLIASDGTTLWVSTDTAIVGIDPSTNAVKARVTVPRTAYSSAIAATPGALWLDAPDADPLTISRYDSRTGALVASVPVPDALQPIAADGAIWVAEQPRAAVARIDPATNKVVATVNVGATGSIGLGDVAAGSDGAIWVVNGDASTIVEISPSTNTVLRTLTIAPSVLTASSSLVVDQDAIWATLGSSITRIDPLRGASAWTATLDGAIQRALIQPDAVWVGLDPHTASKAGMEVALNPTTGAQIDALSIPDGQVSDALEAFGSVWLVLGQQGLVERFSPAILTVRH
jgi:streptogramin lyase